MEKNLANASNQIKFIDKQIDIIKDLEDKNTIYPTPLIKNFTENELVRNYYQIESKLIDKKKVFIENDKIVEDLKNQKNNLLRVINGQNLSILNSQKDELLEFIAFQKDQMMFSTI